MNSIQPEQEVTEVFAKKIYSDSLSTTFVIWVKTNVLLHKHEFHTEQVYILAGTAIMVVGDSIFTIKPGDMIFIPENTPHSVKVTSIELLKVISIQSPEFLGNDRVILE